MYMEHIKFISAQQAKSVHLHKNTKEKLRPCWWSQKQSEHVGN